MINDRKTQDECKIKLTRLVILCLLKILQKRVLYIVRVITL